MPACPIARLASFHLVRHRRALDALGHLATARRLPRGVPGLVCWRLLGTGRGADTGPSADLRRTALFAVWAAPGDLDRFLAAPPRAWAVATERYDVRLRAIGGHGAWRGARVLDGVEPGTASGRIAVLTRADVRVAAWRRFRRAGPDLSAALRAADGLLAVAGVGEAPVGRLGTFSLWRDERAVEAFARSPRHAAVVARTRAERWYGEELFARFEPFGSRGTWDGRDPLA